MGIILGLNYVYMFGALFWIAGHELDCGLVCGASVCVRETMLESTILAQASRTRLGEINKDSNIVVARAFRLGEEIWLWAIDHLA